MASMTPITKQALTVSQAQTLLKGESHVNALWENKNIVMYVLSKFFSVNGLIPVFFDYGVAASADRKIQAQLKPVNEALANLVKATAARANPKAVDSQTTIWNGLARLVNLGNSVIDAVVADSDASESAVKNAALDALMSKATSAEVKAEQKALQKLSNAAFTLFAQTVDMSKATDAAAAASRENFAKAIRHAVIENRGSVAKSEIQSISVDMVAKSAIKHFATTTSLKTLNDPKASGKFFNVATKLSGLSKQELREGILAKQAEKTPAIIDDVNANIASLEKAAKKNQVSKEQINEAVQAKEGKVKELKDDIKALQKDKKALKKDISKAAKAAEKSLNAFVKAFNKCRPEGSKLTRENALGFVGAKNMPEATFGGVKVKDKKQDALIALWDEVLVKDRALSKVQAKKPALVEKITAKENERTDLKAAIKNRRAGHYAGIKAEIAQDRKEKINVAKQNLRAMQGE